ncbi:MOB kinase activator [Acrasis kona]
MDVNKSMKPLKDFRRSTVQSMHKNATATLGIEDIENCVKLPPNEDKNEWLAVHVVDFYNVISLIYGQLQSYCDNSTCPQMSAGQSFMYLWRDENNDKMEPIKLSAKEYISRSLNWIRSTLDDEKVFPSSSDVPFPKKFEKIVKSIFKRIFRIYAHILYDHFPKVQALGIEAHINSSLKHFLLFSFEFGLLGKNELEPLNEHIINRLGSQYASKLNKTKK